MVRRLTQVCYIFLADPWEHVLLMGVGAGLGSYLQSKYHRDLEEVEELRQYLERRSEDNKEA